MDPKGGRTMSPTQSQSSERQEQSEEIAHNLDSNLRTMQAVHGKKWPALLADYCLTIQEIMERDGTSNPLKAILPVAREMEATGKSPSILLAAATYMISKTKLTKRK
jgi:hypothetical protein